MSETFARWFEPIISNPVAETIIAHKFLTGIFAGILLVYLLRLVIWLSFRKKYCKEITVKNSSGDISISVGAISNVIVHDSKALKCLDVRRVRVSKLSGGYLVDIRAALDSSCGTAPKLMEQLSEIVKTRMKDVFGIDNVQQVTLSIVSCSGGEMPKPAEKENGFKDLDDDKETEFFHSAGHGDRTISLKNRPQENKEAEKDLE